MSAAIKSPCIKTCFIDPELAHCVGCWRSLEEIGRWSIMDDDERDAVMNALKARGGDLRQRYYERRGLTPPEAI